MKQFSIPLLPLLFVFFLPSGVFGEPATFYNFETTYLVNKKVVKKVPGQVIVSKDGKKFEAKMPPDELESTGNLEKDIVSFNAEKQALYDIDPPNEEFRVINEEFVKRQKKMVDEMNAQFGMENQPGMGSGQNQALFEALKKVREAQLQALKEAKGKGDLPPEAEREMMKRIGPPPDPPEIKKTGKTRHTKWGNAVAYEERRGGTLVERSWVLPWTKVPNGKAAQDVIEAMRTFMEKLIRGFPGIKQMNQPMLAKWGMPWKTEYFNNDGLVSVQTFTGATEGKYTFGPPSHFKETTEGFGKSPSAPQGRVGGSFPGGGMPSMPGIKQPKIPSSSSSGSFKKTGKKCGLVGKEIKCE